MTSRLNNPNQALTQKNVNTHIFTEFSEMNKETTQQQVLDAIKNINLNVGEIVVGDIAVESSDSITHTKLDILNTTLTNKTLSKTTSSIDISGQSVNVGNFPATQTVSGTVGVNNFPTTQTVSGTVGVSSLPAIAITNTSFEVSNFPATQTVSGSVGVNNFPATQTVSGTVGVSSLPAIAITNTSFEVSNFPATQTVSGTVGVNNFPTTQTVSGTVGVSNFPATQTVSGSVIVNTISGFALETGGNLASIKTNTDRIKSDTTNTDAIQVQVKNTSIPVTGTFYPETQAVSGSVTVNTISGFALETGGNLASIKTNTDRIKSDTTNTDAIQVQVKNTSIPVTGTFYPETQAVSGSVTVNTISGFALETGGNLASIKTNTDRIKSDTTNTDAIQVQVKNTSIPVTGTFYPETQAVSGSVTVNTISGFALETGGNLASIKTNTDRIKSDTTNTDAIQVAVKNTVPISGNVGITGTPTVTVGNSSIDTHCYASSNGTSWHHLKSDASGILNTHSMIQDGAGNDITSTTVGTTRGLDVNIIGGGGGGGGGLVQIQDSNGNTLSAVSSTVPQLRTTIYSASGVAVNARPVGSTYANSLDTYNKVLDDNNFSGTGIKTVPQLFITGSSPNQYTTPRINGVGDQYVTLSTNSGGNTVQFDNSTANGNKIKIDSTTGNNIVALATGANTVKIDSTTNTIKIDSTTNTIKIGDGTFTANILPTIANIQNAEGLVCDSALYAFNTSSGEVQPLTVNLNGNKNQLEVRDNDAIVELTSIDNKLLTTTPYSVAGLNVYPIYPKKIHYTLMGRSEATVNAVIMGGSGSQKFYYDFSFGLANPQTFSAVQSGGSLRTIKYHYVDSGGVLRTDGTATFSALNSVVILQPTNMISINKFWIEGFVGLSEQVLIRVGTLNNAVNTIASADVDDYYNGVITVPNGYIGYLTNYSLFTPSPAFVFVLKWDALGNRSVVFNHYNSANAPIPSGANGSIGGIFTAGESIAFGRSAVGASIMCGNFVLEPI